MMIFSDEIRTAISVIALMVSFISLYFSRRWWLESNRPIVTAFVAEHNGSNVPATFKLVVSNTGNRPATNIRLHASTNDLSELVKPTARLEWRDSINRCFSDSAIIPVLRNDEELSTAFGAFNPNSGGDEWINYGACIQIRIEYSDLVRRNYKSTLPLKVYMREGFGGSIWVSNKRSPDKA